MIYYDRIRSRGNPLSFLVLKQVVYWFCRRTDISCQVLVHLLSLYLGKNRDETCRNLSLPLG